MFLFLVAVALVVAASLIFVFTMNWDEDADYPDEALQRKENANKKSIYYIHLPGSDRQPRRISLGDILRSVSWMRLSRKYKILSSEI